MRRKAATAPKPEHARTVRALTLEPQQDYTINEAAVLLCSSRSGVYRLVRDGFLTLKKRGRRSRIAGSQIIAANDMIF